MLLDNFTTKLYDLQAKNDKRRIFVVFYLCTERTAYRSSKIAQYILPFDFTPHHGKLGSVDAFRFNIAVGAFYGDSFAYGHVFEHHSSVLHFEPTAVASRVRYFELAVARRQLHLGKVWR